MEFLNKQSYSVLWIVSLCLVVHSLFMSGLSAEPLVVQSIPVAIPLVPDIGGPVDGRSESVAQSTDQVTEDAPLISEVPLVEVNGREGEKFDRVVIRQTSKQDHVSHKVIVKRTASVGGGAGARRVLYITAPDSLPRSSFNTSEILRSQSNVSEVIVAGIRRSSVENVGIASPSLVDLGSMEDEGGLLVIKPAEPTSESNREEVIVVSDDGEPETIDDLPESGGEGDLLSDDVAGNRGFFGFLDIVSLFTPKPEVVEAAPAPIRAIDSASILLADSSRQPSSSFLPETASFSQSADVSLRDNSGSGGESDPLLDDGIGSDESGLVDLTPDWASSSFAFDRRRVAVEEQRGFDQVEPEPETPGFLEKLFAKSEPVLKTEVVQKKKSREPRSLFGSRAKKKADPVEVAAMSRDSGEFASESGTDSGTIPSFLRQNTEPRIELPSSGDAPSSHRQKKSEGLFAGLFGSSSSPAAGHQGRVKSKERLAAEQRLGIGNVSQQQKALLNSMPTQEDLERGGDLLADLDGPDGQLGDLSLTDWRQPIYEDVDDLMKDNPIYVSSRQEKEKQSPSGFLDVPPALGVMDLSPQELEVEEEAEPETGQQQFLEIPPPLL